MDAGRVPAEGAEGPGRRSALTLFKSKVKSQKSEVTSKVLLPYFWLLTFDFLLSRRQSPTTVTVFDVDAVCPSSFLTVSVTVKVRAAPYW